MRWGAKGSFRVIVSGPKQGACCDFEGGWKGDPLALIMRERRTDFQGAIEYGCQFVGIAFDGKSKPEDPAERAARYAERERKRAEASLEQKADEAKRIAYARNLWNASGPIDGTAAVEYLAIARAIPRPATGWPDATVRYHAGTASLILAGTNAVGEVCFVQRIALTIDGRKIDDTPKITNGVMAGCYMRLPGLRNGSILLLAEGAETALSTWTATGYETWASIGSITRHDPPAGRQVVVARDDDPQQSPADQALKRSMSTWLAVGVDVTIATPWPVRRHDRSDFNDTLKEGGAAAVRARIATALEPAHDPVHRITVENGRAVLRKAIDEFYRQAEVYNNARTSAAKQAKADQTEVKNVRPYPVHGIKADVGLGKSEISMANIAIMISAMRAAKDKRTVVIAIPAHKLGDQQVQRLAEMPQAAGIKAAVWRSRKAKIEGKPMCYDLDAVADAEQAMADVQTSVCRKVTRDGIHKCEFFDECPFQRQRALNPDVWFVAHELLFGKRPEMIKEPATVVVDESAWQDGLFGTVSPVRLFLDTLVNESATVPGEPLATGQLQSTRTNLHAALSQMMNGAGDLATLLPALRSEVVARGIDVAATREAFVSEWKRKLQADIYPGMPPKRRKEAVQAVIHNKVVAKLAMLWKAVGHLVANDGPEKSGWISIGMSQTEDGIGLAIYIKGRRDVHESWHVPTLLLDATMQPDLVRHFWPTMKLMADIRLQTPDQHIRQVRDRSYSQVQLGKASGLRDTHAIICREARRYRGRVLVVAQMAVEDALPGIGPLPLNIETGHHNAVAGRDEWGPGPDRDGVEALIVVGRTAPSPAAVKCMAEALTGLAIDPLPSWYEKADAAYEMADGTFRPAETDRHPNVVAEAVRWHILEGELIQIIGRARGVNRTKDNPVDILVMTNAPLPIPVERLISAADLDPSPADFMMAAGGVSFENPADASTSYQHIWATREAAKKAMERHAKAILGTNRNKEYLITVCPQDRRKAPQRPGWLPAAGTWKAPVDCLGGPQSCFGP